MTTKNYSQFPAASALTGAELVPLWQGGVTKQTPLSSLLGQGSITLYPSGDTTGATDTAAFQAAYAAAVAGIVTVAWSSNRVGTVSIRLGAGIFYINAAGAMMTTGISANTAGLRFVGAGAFVTTIRYIPTVSGALCTNSYWQGVSFEGMSFSCSDSASDFMDSNMVGAVQDLTFTNCTWSGSWNNIFSLTGTNNNSEWKISHCSVFATALQNWLYTPAAGGSDQFLNFWWDDCKFWASGGGSWVTLNVGGHVRITAGDVSGWAPSSPTYLFNLLGSAHASGVCSFSLDVLRMQKPSANALLLNCAWNQGNVSFRQLDESPTIASFPAATVNVVINYSNTSGPNYTWQDCQLAGIHNYVTGTNNFQTQCGALYENVTLLQNNDPAGFIQWNGVGNGGNGGSNSGGAPRIDFVHCKNVNNSGTTGYFEVIDSNHLWQYTAAREIKPHTLTLSYANDSLPLNLGTSTPTQIAANALILSASFYVPASVTGAWGYKLQSQDLTQTYATWSGAGGVAYYNTVTLAVPVSTGTTTGLRQLVMVETQGRTPSTVVGTALTVNYIG